MRLEAMKPPSSTCSSTSNADAPIDLRLQRAVLAHHLDQHALAQAPIGDPQPRQRERMADRVENGAARQHQIGALDADAIDWRRAPR